MNRIELEDLNDIIQLKLSAIAYGDRKIARTFYTTLGSRRIFIEALCLANGWTSLERQQAIFSKLENK